MKKSLLYLVLAVGFLFTMNSCYTYSFTVGEGAQTGIENRKMNHYLIYGLAPVNVTTPEELADGAENYDVTIQHTFVDGLIQAITFGIYTPTTTIVRK